MDKKEFSEALKTLKLLLSSLFARKQPYLIIDFRTPNTLYYTNIECERVGLYRPTMEDVLSKVTITEPKLVDLLYTAFPAFRNMIAQINLKDFSTALNKFGKYVKDRFPDIKYDVETRKIWITIDPEPGNKEDHLISDYLIGEILTDLDPEFYSEIIDKYSKFSDCVVQRRFRASEGDGDDKLTLEIVEIGSNEATGLKTGSQFAIPVKDGFSMPSFKEYCRRRAIDPIYDLMLQVNEAMNTTKATILYQDDWLSSMTIMPGSLWFMSRIGF